MICEYCWREKGDRSPCQDCSHAPSWVSNYDTRGSTNNFELDIPYSSAPELLEVLEDLLEHYESYMDSDWKNNELVDRAKTVISKAKGEA